MNKINRINELVNQTDNKNNENTDVKLTLKEINKIQHKFNELHAFSYVKKEKLKIGKNIRYYNPEGEKLSTHCTIMDIEYYGLNKTQPRTLLVYSKYQNSQWKINCKKYIFFEQYTKIDKNYGHIAGLYSGMLNNNDNENNHLVEEVEKYLKSLKNDE
jgi:hypothetical protein